MSVEEISFQGEFADIAYKQIDPKAARGMSQVFSSIHSFLSHCAMISKMLRADDGGGRTIGMLLSVSSSSAIHDRKLRNCLEHYDKELKKWIAKHGVNQMIGTYNLGPKSGFGAHGMLYVSHYDPSSHTFTFVNEDFDLAALHAESRRIRSVADSWRIPKRP